MTDMTDFINLDTVEVLALDRQLARYLCTQTNPEYHSLISHSVILLNAYQRDGHSHLPLEEINIKLIQDHNLPLTIENWKTQLKSSGLTNNDDHITDNPLPLVLNDNKLYFHRTWHYETKTALKIIQLTQQNTKNYELATANKWLDLLFPTDNRQTIDWQRVAAVIAIIKPFSLISGGPGTGKTRTVARILATLTALKIVKPNKIGLVAPTGKAAGRLNESIAKEMNTIQSLNDSDLALDIEAVTVHRLLGASGYNSTTRFNEQNPLDLDLLLVDEASMLDLSLFSRLMQALTPNTRVILLGDRDQLPSVELGNTLGDLFKLDSHYSDELIQSISALNTSLPEPIADSDNLIQKDTGNTQSALSDCCVLLRHSHRFDANSGIGKLASAIKNGNIKSAQLAMTNYEDVTYLTEINRNDLIVRLRQQWDFLQQSPSPEQALQAQKEFQLLLARRTGRFGVETINTLTEQSIRLNIDKKLQSEYSAHFHGQPIIITQNSPERQVYNGDTGVVFQINSVFYAYFESENGLIKLPLNLLPNHESCFAMTIHKSQGSEFTEVWYYCSESDSLVGSRSLLYTAVTRSKKKLTLIGAKDQITSMINKNLERKSALGERLIF